MIRNSLISLLIVTFAILSNAQTCCSGGVPVSSNIGFQSSDAGTLQISISGDFNFLHTLKSESETLDDDLRLRTTQSYIVRGAYAFSDRWTIETFIPLVRQSRRITTLQGPPDIETTFGIGDPLALAIYNVINKGVVVRLGVGPQFPIGSFSERNDRGLTLLEDLQPGSGAWDIVLFGSLEYSLPNRPSALVYTNIIRSFTGANNESRNGTQQYEFGNDIQIITGYSDQVLFFSQIFSPGVSFRYRHAERDRVNGIDLPGTGGDFAFMRFSNGVPFPKLNSSLSLNVEIPIWTKVNETQLAPSLILNIGWFKTFEPKSEADSFINLNQK